MSTIVEHLAQMEFYRALRARDRGTDRPFGNGFSGEAYLFCDVHLGDLVKIQDKAEMETARLEVEARLRRQVPTKADELIAAWHEARAAEVQTPVAPIRTGHFYWLFA
jgi:hypothetical protein